MPHINSNSITKNEIKVHKDDKANKDMIEKPSEKNRVVLVKQTANANQNRHKSQESDSQPKFDKKESVLKKPFVKVRIIDSSKEHPKEKLDKAPLYLEVISGYEGNPDIKTQRIPLPTQLGYSGKDVRFDGLKISKIIGGFHSPTTTVLSGSTDKQVGSKLGSNVSVHVPTAAGDFYFELTPDGNVKLNKIPTNLEVELTTFAKVETNQDLKCRKLKINASEFICNYPVSAKTIEINAVDKIINSSVMTGDQVTLKTIDATNGSINNLKGEIESKVHMDLSSAIIRNAAKLTAKQGDIKIERNRLLHNAKNSDLSAQTRIEGLIHNLKNEGQISAAQVNLTIIESLNNFATGKISATHILDLLAKELINNGEMTSSGLLKCQADTIIQDLVTAQITSKAKLELIANALMRNAGTLSAKELQVTSINGLVHNLAKSLMNGDKITVTAGTVHNESDIFAKQGILKIVATLLLHNDESAKLLSNDLLDIDAAKLINQGLLGSATKTQVIVKDLLDNQRSGVMTAQALVAKLFINETDKNKQEAIERVKQQLLKQILEGRVEYGKEIDLSAGAGIQNVGKLSGGLVTLTSNLKDGFIKILENSSILSQTDINLISKNIDNAGDLTCINGGIHASSQLKKKSDEKIKHEKDMKLRHDSLVVSNYASPERKILKGKLGSTARTIHFEEKEVAKDGSCGFHALGVNRKEVVDLLLQHAKDEKIRKELAPEINNALGGNDIGSAATAESKLLYKRYAECQTLGPKLEAEANAMIKKLDPNALHRGFENLIIYLKHLDKKEYAEILKKLEDHLKFERKCALDMQQYTCSEVAFISYVKSFNNGAWLGYKSARLVAMLKHINLYIWTLSTKASDVVELRESNESVGNKNTIHMLHTSRFSHFNLLSEVDLKQQKELKDGKESRELSALAPNILSPKVEVALPVNPIEPGKIFKNRKTGKLNALQGRIDIGAVKLLNRGSMDAGTVLFNGQKFSHLEGHISAGAHVDISAFDIKTLSDINAQGNIVLRHGGGLWKIADKLHAKGMVHFIWPEARTITQAFTLDGGIHYEILPTAKQPMHFLVNQLVNGDFGITTPTSVAIGNDQLYILLGADHDHTCRKMNIIAKDIYLYNGRMASINKMKLTCENLALGRHAGILQKPSAIACGEDIEFDISNNVGWHYFEMFGLKGLTIKAKNLNNLSSHVIIEGNAILNTPSHHALLVKAEKGNGKPESIGWTNYGAMDAFRILQEQHYTITKPAHFEVGGKLTSNYPMAIFASQVYCGLFEGIMPTEKNFIEHQIWNRQHYYGNPRKDKGWWKYYVDRVVTGHVQGKLSVAGLLKAVASGLSIYGNVTASNIQLTGIIKGHIGLESDLVLPGPGAFKPCIPLIRYVMTSLHESTEKELYGSVYRPILPFQFSNEFGPILIIGADNHLLPNIHNRRCLYSPIQERANFTLTLMNELSRGFLTPQLPDPYDALCTLRKNAQYLYRHGATYLPQDGSITIPLLAYKEIEIIHASGRREIVLIPVLYLPNTFNNPRLRDGSGGLFSFGNILIQGENYRDSTLKITGHIEAKEKILFSTFNEISHTKRMVKKLYYVTDTTEIDIAGIPRVKRNHSHRTLEAWEAAAGNTVTGEEIIYHNIFHVKLEAATLTAGAGGVSTDNVGIFEQRALIEDSLKQDEDSLRLIMNETTWKTYYLEPKLIPSYINSVGPVSLKSYTGFYDNLYINNKLVVGENPQISATELMIGKTQKYIDEQRIAAEVKRLEERRTARRKEAQNLGKLVVISAASAGAAAYIGGLLAATSTFAKGTFMLAATKGAIAGGTSAALNRKNILKGTANGALFAGFGFAAGKYLEGFEYLKNAEKMRERIQILARAGLSTAIHKTHIIDSLLDMAAADLVGNILPVEPEGSTPGEIGKGLARAAVAGAAVAAVTKRDPMSAAGEAILRGVGESVGNYVGETTAASRIRRTKYANEDKNLKRLKESGEHQMDKLAPVLPAGVKKSTQAENSQNFHTPHALLTQLADESAERFFPSNTRYIPQSNRDSGIGSGSGSVGSTRNTSHTALQNVVARLPLKSLYFAQSPSDVINGYDWRSDDRMPQRQLHNITLDDFDRGNDPKNIPRESLGILGRGLLNIIRAGATRYNSFAKENPDVIEGYIQYSSNRAHFVDTVFEHYITKYSSMTPEEYQDTFKKVGLGLDYIVNYAHEYCVKRYDEYGLTLDERAGVNSLFGLIGYTAYRKIPKCIGKSKNATPKVKIPVRDRAVFGGPQKPPVKDRVYMPQDQQFKHHRNGHGSTNPISDNKVLQELLETAYSVPDKKQVYNIHNRKLIKFETNGMKGYHAYEVEAWSRTGILEQIPEEVLHKMKVDGLLTSNEVTRLISNKGI